jgi:predicted RNase H-like HicB family nuclease
MMKYAVVVEKSETGYGAYVPDLPGCIAAGDSREEVVGLIHDAIEFHIEGLKADGETVPEPTSFIEFIEVAA